MSYPQVRASKKAADAYMAKFGIVLCSVEGLRKVAFARSTGTLVAVYNATEAGMDPESGEWVTMCETHSRMVNHESRWLAEAFASEPESFCGVCNGSEQPDEE